MGIYVDEKTLKEIEEKVKRFEASEAYQAAKKLPGFETWEATRKARHGTVRVLIW